MHNTACDTPYPCGCGHSASSHGLVTDTACNECECRWFRGMHLFPPVDELVAELTGANIEIDILKENERRLMDGIDLALQEIDEAIWIDVTDNDCERCERNLGTMLHVVRRLKNALSFRIKATSAPPL